MTSRLMAETFCFAPAQTLASPSTVRWSSAVDSTIELAWTGVAHKAREALSGLSGQERHGRRCRIRAASSAGRNGCSPVTQSIVFGPKVERSAWNVKRGPECCVTRRVVRACSIATNGRGRRT